MKNILKKTQNILSVLLIGFTLSLHVSCTSQYKAQTCETPLKQTIETNQYYYLPDRKDWNFTKKTCESDITFFYEKNLKGTQIDKAINRVKAVQQQLDIPQPVFITDQTISYVNEDGFWVNPSDSIELLGAILLDSETDAELPFGFFAGISANLFDQRSFEIFNEQNLTNALADYPTALEMQYPLYAAQETPKKEKLAAWNFAYSVAQIWLETNTIEQLQKIEQESVTSFLLERGAVLPDYLFIVGDSYY
ncbi:MAG: hypothetical protein IJX87_00240, partial [Clostridia bacterium]|nr:hypothetical protein [Clostridia bacterium]